MRYEVIESIHWVNKVTGATVSPYGAVPYTGETEKANWHIVVRGYTWRDNNTNTIGLCRVPAKTREEADQVCETLNRRWHGEHYDALSSK